MFRVKRVQGTAGSGSAFYRPRLKYGRGTRGHMGELISHNVSSPQGGHQPHPSFKASGIFPPAPPAVPPGDCIALIRVIRVIAQSDVSLCDINPYHTSYLVRMLTHSRMTCGPLFDY